MLLFSAAAIAASPPQAAPSAGASAQATATVRVISGVRLSFGVEQQENDVPRPRQTLIKTGDAQHPAILIEFQ
jgi:hypothetical protein